jgi:two-component system, NarL family, response regulator DevR
MVDGNIQDSKMHVAVVDDDENIRLCYNDILQSEKNFSLVGSFSNAAQALSRIPQLQPDVTVMDIRLPGVNGIECTKRLREMVPHLKIVIVTGTHESNCVDAAIRAGAAAYLFKPVIGDQLLATLRFVLVNKIEPGKVLLAPPKAGIIFTLNPREKSVLQHLAVGLLYKEISEKLGISYTAVHKCLAKVYKKLRVNNRSEAIRLWLDSGGS